MCDGGFFRDSVILASGATGTGKTLLVTQFMAGAAREGERALLFEESRDQLFRNAAAWGMDFEKLEQEGRLRIVNQYPHSQAMEDHLVQMKAVISEFRPNRLAVDSLSALERISTLRGFREYSIDGDGMHIGEPFKDITGVLTGHVISHSRWDDALARPGSGEEVEQ